MYVFNTNALIRYSLAPFTPFVWLVGNGEEEGVYEPRGQISPNIVGN